MLAYMYVTTSFACDMYIHIPLWCILNYAILYLPHCFIALGLALEHQFPSYSTLGKAVRPPAPPAPEEDTQTEEEELMEAEMEDLEQRLSLSE